MLGTRLYVARWNPRDNIASVLENILAAISQEQLQYLINHVFLPLKLPQNAEIFTSKENEILVTLVTELSREFVGKYVTEETPRAKKFQCAVHALEWIGKLHNAYASDLPKGILKDILWEMRDDGDTLPLYLKAQNAGVIITLAGEEAIFETFEVSPSVNQVVDCVRLRMCFPGPAMAIPSSTFHNNGFKTALCSLLAEMHTEHITKRSLPTMEIGGVKLPTTRDTEMPIYITEFFTGMLRGIGRPYESKTFHKRVADEVLMSNSENATSPWRRSPLWLVMRVALQQILLGPGDSRESQHQDYKLLMLHIMARILGIAAGGPSQEGGEGPEGFVSSEILHGMNTKVSRRAAKLSAAGLPLPPALLAQVEGIVKQSARVLDERWSRARACYKMQISWPPEPRLDLRTDTNLTMPTGSGYILSVLKYHQNPPRQPSHNSRTLSVTRRLDIGGYAGGSIHINTHLEKFLKHDLDVSSLRIALVDVEAWVCKGLSEYVGRYMSNDQACRSLYAFTKLYADFAMRLYKNNPQSLSLIILTCMELWVAVDRIATSTCPLLLDYNPPMESMFLSHLLLPTQSLMRRCHILEVYIKHRKSNATAGPTPVAEDEAQVDGNINTFTVRYVETSPKHKQLLDRIIAEATAVREAKRAEYAEASARYQLLRLQIANMSCECEFTGMIGKRVRVVTCERCRLTSEADNMSITVHEWPLPSNENARKAAIFELDVPVDFSAWRDMAYWLVTHVLYDPQENATQYNTSANIKCALESYTGLRNHYRPKHGQEITWASDVESFMSYYQSKRWMRSVVSVADILLPTALRFRAHFRSKSWWARDQMSTAISALDANVRTRCTFQLAHSYKAVQQSLESIEYTPNQCIANQHNCPWQEMSLTEFEAFTLLRSGFRLQWWNILREIRAGTLNLNQIEVHWLFAQAIWQAGPPSSGSGLEEEKITRESHLDLLLEEFGIWLIGSLDDVFKSVAAPNWFKRVVLRTIIILSSRIISLTSSSTVRSMAANLLRRCRGVTLNWLRMIQETIRSTDRESNITTLYTWQVQALEVAVVCRSTFGVDSKHYELICSGESDLADLIECAIGVQNYALPNLYSLPNSLRFLLEGDLRLAQNLEKYLESAVIEHPQWFDAGIRRIWNEYEGDDNGWKKEEAFGGWIGALTRDGRKLCFNLLSAEFLVEYKLFGRLPTEFVNHPTYTRIFGNRILAAVSNNNGKDFQLLHTVCKEARNLKVTLTMRQGELIIRTTSSTTDHELIPDTKLKGDFPVTFITPFAHFLNLTTHELEFRPLGADSWIESQDNWVVSIAYTINGVPWRSQGRCKSARLVDFHSRTSLSLQKLLGPLECKEYIEILASGDEMELTVRLPRYKLTFQCQVNEMRKLTSRSFPGKLVDVEMMAEHNLNTLCGLRNMLILRTDTPSIAGHNIQRTVLIPYGAVSAEFDHYLQHTAVKITPEVKEGKIDYHLYNVDTSLGRLASNGSLQSHFYKIYLHALTSYCLPDPLTGLTGTEEALDDLRSALSWSFTKLGTEEIGLLRLIAAITPQRTYYTEHLKGDSPEPSKLKIEQIVWVAGLPSYAQHGMFDAVVRDIFMHWQRTRFLHPEIMRMEQQKEKQEPVVAAEKFEVLHRRAAVRQAAYLPHAYGGDIMSTNYDADYTPRYITNSIYERRVCHIANLVKDWSTHLDTTRDLATVLRSWGSVVFNIRSQDWEDLDDNIRHWHRNVLSQDWFSLYNLCRKSSQEQHTYQLLFLLCSLAYRGEEEVPLELVYTLLGFATMSTFKSLDPPRRMANSGAYGLGDGAQPSPAALESILNTHRVPFESSTESRLPQLNSEGAVQYQERLQGEYEANLKQDIAAAVSHFSNQWVCKTVKMPFRPPWRLINANDQLLEALNQKFTQWHSNKEYLDHIRNVQTVLNTYRLLPGRLPDEYSFEPSPTAERSHTPYVSIGINTLLSKVDPSDLDSGIVEHNLRIPRGPAQSHPGAVAASEVLHNMLMSFNPAEDSGGFGRRYIQDLLKSFKALQTAEAAAPPVYRFPREEQLQENERKCAQEFEVLLSKIRTALSPAEGTTDSLLQVAGLWPRATIRTLLRQLTQAVRISDEHRLQPSNFYMAWRGLLITFGELITKLQKATRLSYHARTGNAIEFSQEVANKGWVGWSAEGYPEWLLFEIENNLLIRPVQAEIAEEMLTPRTGRNSVMQLNMGEGKSSVIVPIVAAALSDRTRLVRVIVLKSLCNQMFHLLGQKLGGLLNRRIYYVPFSRDVSLNDATVETILQLYKECMGNGGILLTQPDHLLSFRLIGIECLSRGDTAVHKQLLDSQKWLDTYSRDILDESDEVLDVKYQVIYTLGKQQLPDLHAERWTIIQEIFDLILKNVHVLKQQHPKEVELLDRGDFPGSFPFTRLLQPAAGKKLLAALADDAINNGALKALPTSYYNTELRQKAFEFVSKQKVSEHDAEQLRHFYGQQAGIPLPLLLLRGLLTHGIIRYVLQDMRYRVDYGLDPRRTMLAVPYRAKDSPAPRAEFGHPDVAIALTCLSYYYHGLSEAQLHQCFKKLHRLANSAQIYSDWISKYKAQLPQDIHDVSGINTQDPDQWNQHTFPKLRYNKGAVDFYLATMVFPRVCKEFPHKLTTTGWDLAEEKGNPTTGFSGTNDNRYLLPLPIEQVDSAKHLHTNAKVLQYLLQPENNYYHLAAGANNERVTVHELIDLLVAADPPVQVLLDVGAQVLEMHNLQVVEAWLNRSPTCWEAAVYFNDDDELTALSRDGTREPLMLSAYARNMNHCLVYLDEAHTRGTDLKLPSNSRAAVTLGPRLTKDRLVQACMRMRKLGNGQSVIFFAPPEVHAKIFKVSSNNTGAAPTTFSTTDIIKWVMNETCVHTQRGIPLWATQGLIHQRQQCAWATYTTGHISGADVTSAWLEREARTLEEHYGVKAEGVSLASLTAAALSNPDLQDRYSQLNAIRAKCVEFGVINMGEREVSVAEEQEREVEQEIQVELPPRAKPLKHHICPQLSRYIANGRLDVGIQSFLPAMQSLSRVSFYQLVEHNPWCSDLYVTADFMNTVELDSVPSSKDDDFLRRVTWVVSNTTQPTLLIISPYEAQHFLPDIRRSSVVRLHIYSAKVQSNTFCFEDLGYSIPPVPRGFTFNGKDHVLTQLNIFSGQLFFSSYESYQRTCELLGIFYKRGAVSSGQIPAAVQTDGWLAGSWAVQDCDGYVRSQLNSGRMVPFAKSPIEFIRRLAEVRRKGEGLEGTHVGKLVHATAISHEDF